jgi:hypothetical protein
VSITDCDFKDTVAGGNGGAVSSASANIKNCGFETTRAGNYGGAVYVNGGSLTIDGYTSNDTVAVNGGSLYISGSSQVSIKNASIANSQAINSSGENYTHGGGGIWIQDTTAEFTNVTFTDVKAQGSGDYIHGGAVFFSNNTQLTMTACSINTASSNNGGGAIGGAGPSSCKLYGVSFTNCSAPQGSLLYGNKYSNSTGAPAYTVGPGCTVNGTEITIYNWSSFNTDSLIYLINGATIIPGL